MARLADIKLTGLVGVPALCPYVPKRAGAAGNCRAGRAGRWAVLLVCLWGSACSWPKDNPLDPYRCEEGCPDGQWCFNGRCVYLDQGGAKPDRSTTGPGDAMPNKDAGKPCTTASQCNDNLTCTQDSCPDKRCVNQFRSGWCLVNGACKPANTSSPDAPYLICKPSLNTRAWSEMIVETFAGTGNNGSSNGHKGPLTAEFDNPWGIAVYAPSGDGVTVWVTEDGNDALRKIEGQTVTTYEGLRNPKGVAVDPTHGHVYVVDGNRKVFRMKQSGKTLEHWAGTGSSGQPPTQRVDRMQAPFTSLRDIAVDTKGRVYVTDAGSHVVWLIDTDDKASVLAGNGKNSGAVDGKQPLKAEFFGPHGIAVGSSAAYLYLTDSNRVFELRGGTAGKFILVAGGNSSGSANGDPTTARFNYPESLALGHKDALLVADSQNRRLRMIYNKQVSLVTGGTSGNVPKGTTPCALKDGRFGIINGVAVDNTNHHIYFTDRNGQKVRRLRHR